MITITNKQLDYFGECLCLTNEKCEMLIMIEKGPRIISFKLLGKENIMCMDTEEKTTMSGGKFAEMFGDDKWYIYGGHRLWLSPENDPKSYYPDNHLVDVKINQNVISLTPPPQAECGLQFAMVIEFSETEAKAKITHEIVNIAKGEQTLSPWAMTVVDINAVTIFPQSEKQTGLLSNRNFTIWPYTDLRDDRLYIGNKYLTLQQEKGNKQNVKFGYNNDKGFVASLNKGQLFIKRFSYEEGKPYPDNGCNCAAFTNFFMMEVETQGVLTTLKPGESVVHKECWELLECEDTFNRKDDNSIDGFVKKYVK